MKKIISLLLCICMLLPAAVFAEEEVITVIVDGTELETPVPPQLVNDRTMLPMRAIFEALGAQVTWMEADQLIFATRDTFMIVLQIGNPKMSVQRIDVDGNTAVELDVAPYLYGDHTLVPARAVAEALEANVEWIGETNTVVITQ